MNLAKLVTADRVHRSLYVDPEVFEREMTQVYGATWTYVTHESRIPLPGDFVTTRLGRRPVIVCRAHDGTVRTLLNRCSHRGATVCRTNAGNATRFVCPYHGWTYGLDGALTGTPYRRGQGAGFEPAALGLRELRTESFEGFVFATFDAAETPLAEHLGGAGDVLREWLHRKPGEAVMVEHGAQRVTYQGNWKLACDNAADGYHIEFTHTALTGMWRARYGVSAALRGGEADERGHPSVATFGRGHSVLRMDPSDEDVARPLPPFPGREQIGRLVAERHGPQRAGQELAAVVPPGINLLIFPNLLIAGNQIQVVEPLSVRETRLTWWATSPAKSVPEAVPLSMRQQEDFLSTGEPDDLANFEACQDGLEAPEAEWVMTSRYLSEDEHTPGVGPMTSELPIRAFWRRWLELMAPDQTGAASW